MNLNIDAEVTIKVNLLSLIDEDALQDVYNGDLLDCAKDHIKENGLCGVIGNDFEIVAAKYIPLIRSLTCESCKKFQETCSRVIIDNRCFQYQEVSA